MTLQDAIAGFLIEQQIRGNSEKTLVYYRSSLSRAAAFLGEGLSLDDLTLSRLREYYLSLREKGLSSVTLQSYIRALRSFLTWCYREEYISQDLSEKFRLPKAQPSGLRIDHIQRAGRDLIDHGPVVAKLSAGIDFHGNRAV